MPLKLYTKCLQAAEGFGKRSVSYPQRGLCPLEENSEFQGFLADGTRLFIPLLKQVEILIST